MNEKPVFETELLKLYVVARVFIRMAENRIELYDDEITGLYNISEEANENLKKFLKEAGHV